MHDLGDKIDEDYKREKVETAIDEEPDGQFTRIVGDNGGREKERRNVFAFAQSARWRGCLDVD